MGFVGYRKNGLPAHTSSGKPRKHVVKMTFFFGLRNFRRDFGAIFSILGEAPSQRQTEKKTPFIG
jgi:hypothetical protein